MSMSQRRSLRLRDPWLRPILTKPAKRGRKPRRRIVRTARPRARRKGSVAAFKRKLDRLWSTIVKTRDGWRCRALHRHEHDNVLQADHLIPKGPYPYTRFFTAVGICVCRSAHVWLTHRPNDHVELAMRQMGQSAYEHFLKLARVAVHVDLDDVRSRLMFEAEALRLDDQPEYRALVKTAPTRPVGEQL